MAVGVWEPGGSESASKQVEAALIDRFVRLASETGESISEAELKAAELATENWVMTLEPDAWMQAESLETGDIVHLVRLFTLVEQQVPGWDAGRKSPVIPLVKMLKSRDAFPAELRKWIKAHTDNRYLPNGSAL